MIETTPNPLPPFLGDLGPDAPAPGRVMVLPIGYEATVSYEGGTRYGPRAILEASTQVELYDMQREEEPAVRFGVETLPPMALDAMPPEQAVKAITEHVAALPINTRFLFGLGGEHTVTVGLVRGVMQRIGEPITLVQIDAHCDLRDSYEDSPYSHACIARRAFDDGVEQIVQLGIRSMCSEEAAFIAGHRDRIHVFDGRSLHGRPSDEYLAELRALVEGRKVYLTLDVDGLDPSIIPATGTPEPGGLGWYPTLDIIRTVCESATVVAADCVELAPRPGLHAADFAAAKLVYQTMAMAVGK